MTVQSCGMPHCVTAAATSTGQQCPPSASSVLFHSPSIGSRLSATVYLTSAPVFPLRITTTAIAPGGAFSAAIVSVRWPGLAIVAIMPHPRCTRTW